MGETQAKPVSILGPVMRLPNVAGDHENIVYTKIIPGD